MLRMYNGSILFANPASKNSRTHGLVRRSDDDAMTWPYAFQVTNESTPYAYSCLTEVADKNSAGLLWETGHPTCTGPSCRIMFSKFKVM